MKLEKAVDIVRQAAQMLLEVFGKQLSFFPGSKDRRNRHTLYDLASLEIICLGLLKNYPGDGLMGEGLKDSASKLGIELNDQGILPGESGKVWVIDPICGSVAFVRGIPDFIISVAQVSIESLKPLVGIIFDPCRDELFYAETGKGSFLNNQPIRVSTVESAQELKNRGVVSIEHRIIREEKYSASAVALCQKIGALRVASTCGLELAYVAAGRIDAVLKAIQPFHDYIAGLQVLREAGGMATNFNGLELVSELSYKRITDIIASNGKIHHFIAEDFRQG